MLTQHLAILASKVASFSRNALDFCNHFVRGMEGHFIRFQGSNAPLLAASATSSPPTGKRSRRLPPPLLIHYHIFKNAGTSFRACLTEALGDQALAGYDTPSSGGFISRRDLARFARRHPHLAVIASHQAAPPAPRIAGRQVLSSILIRDPIARIRSMYAFEKRQEAQSKGALKAKQLAFREYVQWRLEETPAVLSNFQVLFCTRTSLDQMMVPEAEQLHQAIANLDTITIVGTVERYGEWLSLAQKVLTGLNSELNLPLRYLNVTGEKERSQARILEHLVEELGEELALELLRRNELDMALHQVADALLTRRLAEYKVDVKLRRAYANACAHLSIGNTPGVSSP